MKIKLLSLIGVAALVASISVQAGKYMVYKGAYQVEKYSINSTTGNMTFDKKNDKLKFTIYMVVPTGKASIEKIQRVVAVTTKEKYTPVGGGKDTKKLVIDPTVDIDAQYSGTAVDKYTGYAGSWDTAIILGAGGSDKNYYAIVDYYRASSKLYDGVCGYGESYSGVIKKGVAKSLKGSLSYYDGTNGEMVISRKAALKYDKKFSEKESAVYNADTIEAAAEAVVKYLVGKKYASTWTE